MAEAHHKKRWYTRWWAIILYILIGFIILGAIFGGNESSKSQDTTSDNQVATPQKETPPTEAAPIVAKPETPNTYSIGDSIAAGDFTWKITKVTTAKQVGEEVFGTLMGEKADGIFLILDVEVENTGNSAKYLMDSFVTLVDDKNREFSPDSVAAMYLKPEGSALMFEQLNPGIKKIGKIVYDVPEGLTVVDIKIASNLFSSSVYTIKATI